MPIATPDVYAEMIDRAKSKGFAYPAINITSSQTIIAAIKGFADAGSDGIIQVSTGGAEYASGQNVKDMVTGAVALAEFARAVADKYPVNIALHTDHCQKEKLDTFVRPLMDISAERVKRGEDPLFQSHMWDGSAVSVPENLQIAEELLALTTANKQILEIEVGVVGGEEDGVSHGSTRSCPPLRTACHPKRSAWARRSLHHGSLRQRTAFTSRAVRCAPGAEGDPGRGWGQVRR